MQVEHRITTMASPRAVFRLYEEVRHWHTWDPDTQAATLDGPFAVGSRGRLTPTKGRAVPMVLTKVERERCFTVESRIPFFRMRFEHELVAAEGQTEIVHRVTFSGLLTPILGNLLAKQLNTGLPVTLQRLKALAESRMAG
mgnify:CR=1 FL=1